MSVKASSAPWRPMALGDFISLRRGHDLTWRDRREGNVPVMGSAGQNGFHDTALAPGPGVVLGRSGASFGQAHYVRADYWPHNTALYVTDFRGNDPRFVYYFLDELDFSQHNSGGAQQSLNRNFIGPIEVLVPPRDEQEYIVGALDDIDNLISSLERLISKKRAIRQGMMRELLTGRTRFPEFTSPWLRASLGSLYDRHKELVDPRQAQALAFHHFSIPAFDAGLGPVVETGSSIDSVKFSVPKGAILISKLNPRIPRVWAPEAIGPTAVASTEFIVATAASGVDRSFLKWILKSGPVTAQMKLLAVGTTGSHARIHPNQVAALEVAFPEIQEQQFIAQALDDVESEILALQCRLEATRAIKQGMMQELLTGRTRLVPTEAAA